MKSWLKSIQQTRIVKSVIYFIVGVISYPGLVIVNHLKIQVFGYKVCVSTLLTSLVLEFQGF